VATRPEALLASNTVQQASFHRYQKQRAARANMNHHSHSFLYFLAGSVEAQEFFDLQHWGGIAKIRLVRLPLVRAFSAELSLGLANLSCKPYFTGNLLIINSFQPHLHISRPWVIVHMALAFSIRQHYVPLHIHTLQVHQPQKVPIRSI
jgi:hypothetical protein